MRHFTHSKVSKNDQDHSENVKLQKTFYELNSEMHPMLFNYECHHRKTHHS